MMQTFRTEGNYRSADRLSPAELRAAIASREILQSTALAFDTQRQLRFDLGGVKAVMPFGQCADGAESGTVRDIAVLTRVGRPTCFVIEGMETGENGQPCYLLSRAEAQRMCKAEYLDTLQPGDILPCTVTHIEPFGAFCDVGCGISALLPIDCMSVSRISSPADRVSVGQQILCAIKSRGRAGTVRAEHPGAAGHLGGKRRRVHRGRDRGGHCAERGGIRHLCGDRPQSGRPCRDLPRPAPRAGGERLHQNILPDKMRSSWSSSTTAWARATGSTCAISSPRGISTTGCIPPPKAASALRQILRLRLAIRSETLYTIRK